MSLQDVAALGPEVLKGLLQILERTARGRKLNANELRTQNTVLAAVKLQEEKTKNGKNNQEGSV